MPNLPEVVLFPWIAELRGVDVDTPRSVDLAEHRFHLGILDACVFDPGLRHILDGLLVNFTSSCLPEKLRCLPEQDAIHVVHVCLLGRFCGPVVNGKCVTGKAMVLFKLCIEHVEAAGILWRNLLNRLLEQVSRTLELAPTVALDEAGKVGEPDVVEMRPAESFDAAF